ncbi:MAG: hypothetical protein ACTSXH_10515, partial [Promethearchaeota archaeon]
MEEANQMFLNVSKEVLLLLLEQGLIPKKIKVAFDFHEELYYGKKDNLHVISILAEKGTKKVHSWHTCSLILKGRELQVGSEMRKKGGFAKKFVAKMIEFLQSL